MEEEGKDRQRYTKSGILRIFEPWIVFIFHLTPQFRFRPGKTNNRSFCLHPLPPSWPEATMKDETYMAMAPYLFGIPGRLGGTKKCCCHF